MPATAAVYRNACVRHDVADLVALFDALFRAGDNTLLRPNASWPFDAAAGNAREPVYLPAGTRCPRHRVVFAHGFFASALHEVAHWCLAGARRRQLPDYGYWYEPDNRDAGRQAEFERVEARPQALELAFSRAAGFPFRVSIDNLSGIEVDRAGFERRVQRALAQFEARGFPPRAQRFIDALRRFYRE